MQEDLHRAFWELTAGDRPLGTVAWLGGSQLLVACPDPLRSLIRGWFEVSLPATQRHEVARADVDRFLASELPHRLSGCTSRPVEADALSAQHAWLALVERRAVAALGERDPSGVRSNRWPERLELEWLVEASKGGRIQWDRGRWGGFTAGGRTDMKRELWATLARAGPNYVLVQRWGDAMFHAPYLERAGWLRRGPLAQLYHWLDRR